MAITLQNTLDACAAFVQGSPLSAWTGSQPAINIGNMVKTTILQAPFIWNFNRGNLSLSLTNSTQDYTQAVTDFGFAEKASVTDSTGKTWEIKDVQNNEPMAVSDMEARPELVAVQTQTPGTNATFRFSAVPNANYTANIIYQKSPVLFAALSDNWSPLPDSYVVQIANTLCLGEFLAAVDDPRAQIYRQRGVAMLLARAEGLSETDKATFAQSYINFGIGTTVPGLRAQQAQQARGV
jgi:hypothetical protein